jgi:hypothetical protein
MNKCKTVLTFGIFCFFSQKLHHYLFPFQPTSYFDSKFDFMQQNCTMGPLRSENGSIEYIFIAVHDVTETVNFEQKLIVMSMRDALEKGDAALYVAKNEGRNRVVVEKREPE